MWFYGLHRIYNFLNFWYNYDLLAWRFWNLKKFYSEWPVAEWPKEALCLWSIFLPKEVYFWPRKKYKLRKKLIFRQNHLWITPFLTNHFREIFYQFYIPCTRLQSYSHHLTLIFDKSFSAEFQWKIFYFFGNFFS